jgi:hypothetical protein
MNTRARTAMVVLAAASVGIGATARAEPTLRYNFDYVCNQERVVVGHCRHDSDTRDMPPTTPEDDYCQVYYPDRPKGGGIEAMGVVLRGDLIKSLEACGAFGAATSVSNATQDTAATAAPRPTLPAAAPSTAAVPAAPVAAPAQASTGSPPQGPAAAAPGGRPPPASMPIGPPMCPLLRRLEALAHENFRSIELGPDRAFGKDADRVHRTSMPIPGAKCYIDRHEPGDPITYSCMWPASKDVEDQLLSMVKAFEKCTGGTADLTSVIDYRVPDVTMTLRGVEYHTSIVNDFLTLDVHMAKP